jgi:hypothetical protein
LHFIFSQNYCRYIKQAHSNSCMTRLRDKRKLLWCLRQFHEGKELFDEKYDYVDRPTEIEAYRVTLKEARRIGYKGQELVEYLKVDWVSDADFKRFLGLLGVKV